MCVEKEVPKLFGYKLNQFGGVRRSSWWRAFEPCEPNACANALWFASNGKDGGRTSGVEDVPPEPEGEPADLQESRDFLLSFIWELNVSVVRPRPSSSNR